MSRLDCMGQPILLAPAVAVAATRAAPSSVDCSMAASCLWPPLGSCFLPLESGASLAPARLLPDRLSLDLSLFDALDVVADVVAAAPTPRAAVMTGDDDDSGDGDDTGALMTTDADCAEQAPSAEFAAAWSANSTEGATNFVSCEWLYLLLESTMVRISIMEL